jgi:prepilin-type N-terminal cleavage/methylation domain-containing protein
MKKNTIKAFTLVEMLIVIVIIGILIAALMPRMQSAQGRARDVARKNALAQIQTAIITSQQDK